MKQPIVANRRIVVCGLMLLAFFISPSGAVGEPTPGSDDERAETVLITGANRGLGLEFARQYAAAGWTVIGTARKPNDGVRPRVNS